MGFVVIILVIWMLPLIFVAVFLLALFCLWYSWEYSLWGALSEIYSSFSLPTSGYPGPSHGRRAWYPAFAHAPNYVNVLCTNCGLWCALTWWCQPYEGTLRLLTDHRLITMVAVGIASLLKLFTATTAKLVWNWVGLKDSLDGWTLLFLQWQKATAPANAWDQPTATTTPIGPHPTHDIIPLFMCRKYTEEYCFPKSWEKLAHAQSLDTRPFSHGNGLGKRLCTQGETPY